MTMRLLKREKETGERMLFRYRCHEHKRTLYMYHTLVYTVEPG